LIYLCGSIQIQKAMFNGFTSASVMEKIKSGLNLIYVISPKPRACMRVYKLLDIGYAAICTIKKEIRRKGSGMAAERRQLRP